MDSVECSQQSFKNENEQLLMSLESKIQECQQLQETTKDLETVLREEVKDATTAIEGLNGKLRDQEGEVQSKEEEIKDLSQKLISV